MIKKYTLWYDNGDDIAGAGPKPEDELRQAGFSKDGKTAESQIVLGIAKTITTIRLRLPNGDTYTQTLFTTPQQEAIRPLLEALAIGVNE